MKLQRRIQQLEVRLMPPAPQSARMSPEDLNSANEILERVWNQRHDLQKDMYEFIVDFLRKDGFKGKPQRWWFKVGNDED